MKSHLYGYGMILLGFLASCTGKNSRQYTADRIRTVKVDTICSESSLSVLQYPAKVKAAHDINIAFRVSGTIAKVLVKEGEPIHEGQLLAFLDSTDYKVQLQATEAEYRQIKGEAERVMALYKENGTTPNDNDKAVYGLRQIEAKYRNHQDQLRYTRLYAPFSGYVQKRLFDAHETVAAGMPVLSIISKELPEVELNLPVSEYIRRNEFDSYTCTFDVYLGKTYPLKLIGIAEKANANQLYTMRLKMGNEVLPLPSPGMNATVSIACRTEGPAVWSVPGGSVFQKDGREYVYSYANGRVHRIEVKSVRPKSDGTVIVYGKALKQGMCVVVSGVHYLDENEQVNVLQPASVTNEGGLL